MFDDFFIPSHDLNGNVDSLFSDVQSGDPIFQKLRTLSQHNNNSSGSFPDADLSKITSLKALTIGNNPNLSRSLSTFCNAFATRLIVHAVLTIANLKKRYQRGKGMSIECESGSFGGVMCKNCKQTV